MLYVRIEYHIQVNMYHVSGQGVYECSINVHCYYCYCNSSAGLAGHRHSLCPPLVICSALVLCTSAGPVYPVYISWPCVHQLAL